jgi:hypothetical protein
VVSPLPPAVAVPVPTVIELPVARKVLEETVTVPGDWLVPTNVADGEPADVSAVGTALAVADPDAGAAVVDSCNRPVKSDQREASQTGNFIYVNSRQQERR